MVSVWLIVRYKSNAFLWRRLTILKQLGRIVVVPVGETLDEHASPERNQTNDPQPVLLVALNSTDSVDWGELHTRVCHDTFYSVLTMSRCCRA